MGAPKTKWSVEEEDALCAGVEKYGSGKWRFIQKDAYLSSVLHLRSNVDLKDKWRNMYPGEYSLGRADSDYDSDTEPPPKRPRGRAPAKVGRPCKDSNVSEKKSKKTPKQKPFRDAEPEKKSAKKDEGKILKAKDEKPRKKAIEVPVKRGPGRPPGSGVKQKALREKMAKLAKKKEKKGKRGPGRPPGAGAKAKPADGKAKPAGRPPGRPPTGRPPGRPPGSKPRGRGRPPGRPVGRTPAKAKETENKKRKRGGGGEDKAQRPRGRPPKVKEDGKGGSSSRHKKNSSAPSASDSGKKEADKSTSNGAFEEAGDVSNDVHEDAKEGNPVKRGRSEEEGSLRSGNEDPAAPPPPVFIVHGQYRTAEEVTRDAARAVREAEAAAAAAEHAAEEAERREREAWEAERLATELLEEAERQKRDADDNAGVGLEQGGAGSRAMWAA